MGSIIAQDAKTFGVAHLPEQGTERSRRAPLRTRAHFDKVRRDSIANRDGGREGGADPAEDEGTHAEQQEAGKLQIAPKRPGLA